VQRSGLLLTKLSHHHRVGGVKRWVHSPLGIQMRQQTVEECKSNVDQGRTIENQQASMEHQVADCGEFLVIGLDERVEACKGRYMCFKCLDDTSHNFAYCKRSTKCDICSSMTHHTLLHWIRRFHPPPSQASTQKNNPL
jgi:hypothetical protein